MYFNRTTMQKTFLRWLFGTLFGHALQLAAQQPSYAWNYAAGSIWIDEPSYVAVDDFGNVYATGRFSDTVDFDPGPGVTSFSVASGYFGFYLLKLDPQGNFLWAHSINSPNGWGYAVCVDDSNNVLVAGKFTGTGDFDFGPGTYNMTAANPSDMFVMKLDPNAGLIWAKQIIGPISEAPTSIVAKADGSMAITGGFGNTVDFDPGPGVFTMSSANGGAFVLRLDLNGNFLWAGQFQGECKEGAFDTMGNLYMAGLANSGTDIDPGPGVSLLPSAATTYTGVVVKLDPMMSLIWAQPLITTHAVYAEGLAVDAWGNVAVSGSYRGTLDLDPGPGTYTITSIPNTHEDFLMKLDANGNFRWGFSQHGAGASTSSEDVACDTAGAFYRIGRFAGTRDFDPGPGVFTLSNTGSGVNVYIAKQDSAGNFVWAAAVGGISGTNAPHSLAVDAQNNLIWGGQMFYPADMDPGPGTATVNCSTQGDIAVSKWGMCPSIAVTISDAVCDSLTINGQTYTQSGVYTQTLQSVSGCDSILTLDLTIFQPTSSSIQATACNSYTYNGQTYTSSGNYIHTLTNAQGCDSILTLMLTLDTVIATIQQSGNDLTAFPPGATYQWLDCDQQMTPIPGATGQVLPIVSNGSFAVVVTLGSCSDTSACQSTLVGMHHGFASGILPIPNPSQGRFVLDLQGLSGDLAELVVHDALGQVVFRATLRPGGERLIDLGEVARGCYWGLIQQGLSQAIFRVLVE